MKCPLCNLELKMAERQGIEIDYCPQCRGVWLDRGELDKIVERSSAVQPDLASESLRRHEPEQRDRSHGYSKDYHSKKHKRKSFLGDLFDFD